MKRWLQSELTKAGPRQKSGSGFRCVECGRRAVMRVQWSWRCSEHAIQNTEEMRRAAKIDSNQTQIVKALRAIGATVLPMHTLGSGAPDILVGYRGENFALEIKDGEKAPSARKLTPDEEKWHREWQGHVTTVYDVVDALMAIGATK